MKGRKAVMVRVWAWLVTNVFRYRRIYVYLNSGQRIKLHRLEGETVQKLFSDWKSWMNPGGKVVHIQQGKREVIIRMDEVQGVDIR